MTDYKEKLSKIMCDYVVDETVLASLSKLQLTLLCDIAQIRNTSRKGRKLLEQELAEFGRQGFAVDSQKKKPKVAEQDAEYALTVLYGLAVSSSSDTVNIVDDVAVLRDVVPIDSLLDDKCLIEACADKKKAEGIVVIHNDAMFLSSGGIITKDDPVIPKKIAADFNFKTGDRLEVLYVSVSDGASVATDVITVNGIPTEQLPKRFDFAEIRTESPHNRMNLAEIGGTFFKLVDIFAPVLEGQKLTIGVPANFDRAELVNRVAECYSKKEGYSVIAALSSISEKSYEYRENVEYVSVTCKASMLNVAFERAKRLFESGKRVILILEDLAKLVELINAVALKSGKNYCHGIDENSIKIASSMFSIARQSMITGGSITLIAFCSTGREITVCDAIYHFFENISSSAYIDYDLVQANAYPALNVLKCKSSVIADENKEFIREWKQKIKKGNFITTHEELYTAVKAQ